ncbi:ankyrin repeat domain-containing protein [Streptomyces sp. NPDC005349]|uniref:ankyrin repeat domain-containing protein n=1 Tax=Streptomyces sp. NPDC005349 TaxID=3157037 RepID=UPI0033B9976A
MRIEATAGLDGSHGGALLRRAGRRCWPAEALAGGAELGLADKARMTPLHFAAQSQSAFAAELLLAAGATVDVGDRNGNTALFDAVFNYRGDPATLRVLLAAGADPERQNAKGVSPRGLADLIGNYDVAVHVPGAGEDR